MRATAAPWPFAARPLPFLAALLLGAASAQTAPLTASQVLGRAEVFEGGAWRAVSAPAPVRTGLRTGAGRVWLAGSGASSGEGRGTLLVGPQSRLRIYRDKADLQGGQFLLRGPVAAHVLGGHLVLEGGGQARVDLGTNAAARRVALLSGRGRLALGGRVVSLTAGQQVALNSGAVSRFVEAEPWYAAQFTGTGRVTVQATRGPVYVGDGPGRQIAQLGRNLGVSEHLSTGENAWAEVGFAGGGYLRLQESSELGVLSTERTVRGHEVTLQLRRGSALNVVPGGQSGAGRSLASAAVRGSLFQVGAAGLEQTFGGPEVFARAGTGGLVPVPALPVPGTPPLTLGLVSAPRAVRDLTLEVTSALGARVIARVGTRSFPLTPLSGSPGSFRLEQTGAALSEGPHTVQIRAERQGQLRTRLLRVTIDRTPPTLDGLRTERTGRLLRLSGTVRDAGRETDRVTLIARVGGKNFSRNVSLAAGTGTFQLYLPAPAPGTPARLTVRDEAGNETHALLP